MSMGTISPPSRVASSAARLKVKIARSTSTFAALIGFPHSSAIVSASSRRRFPIPSATFRQISAR